MLSFTLYWFDMIYCSDGTSQVALVGNIPPTNTSGIKIKPEFGWEDPLEEEMATHSSILA